MPFEINQMFPFVIPPEIQAEIDKQARVFDGVFNWLESVEQLLLKGEDDDKLFCAPNTPAYHRRKGCTVKPINEESEFDADDTFDISSSSTQSSVTSAISDVSYTRSRRTAAMKASIQIKSQANCNLNSKIRQPSPEVELAVQSNVVTRSQTCVSSSFSAKPSSKMCVDEHNAIIGTNIVGSVEGNSGEGSTSVVNVDYKIPSDDDDVVLPEVNKKCLTKSTQPSNVEVIPGPPSELVQVAVDHSSSEIHLKPEHVYKESCVGDCKELKQRTCDLSKSPKDRRAQDENMPLNILKRSKVLTNEQDPVCAGDVEFSVDSMVKRSRRDTVLPVPSSLCHLMNDAKLKMKVFVSLAHVEMSGYAVDTADVINKVAVVDTAESVEMTKHDVSESKGTDDSTKQNILGTSAEVIDTHVPVVTECDVSVTKQDAVALSKGDLPAGHIFSPKATKKQKKADRKTRAHKTGENDENCALGSRTNSVLIENSLSVRECQLHGTNTVLNCEYCVSFTENLGEDQNVEFRTVQKTGSKYTKSTKGRDISMQDGNLTSSSQCVLDSTFVSAPEQMSSSMALNDISNTMNTSAILRDNLLKSIKKTSKDFGLAFASTPLFNSSSSTKKPLNWNSKVVLKSNKLKKQQEKQRTVRSPVVFSPYAKESVKNRVAKFENLNTLVEATDENTDPVEQPSSVRVTRTKTRAMAAAVAAATKNNNSDSSMCESSVKNHNATHSTARKSLKKAMRISAAKSKREFHTPNTSRDESRMVSVLTASLKKYNNIMVGVDSFLPRTNKGPSVAELERKKEEDQKRQKERAEEACRKKEVILNAKAQEKKRRNEEKMQKVMEKREAQQREEMERKQKQEREKEEKMLRMLQMRDEKLREEQQLKRLQMQARFYEVEERRRLEEALRLARLREQEEQEARRKDQLEKERIAEERAAAREQELLQNQKSNTTFVMNQSSKQDVALNKTYNVEEEVTSYKISGADTNSDDELTVKHTVPNWAKAYQKRGNFTEFKGYTYIPGGLLYDLFGAPEEPDLTRLLGLTSQQVAMYRRKSSMFPHRKALAV